MNLTLSSTYQRTVAVQEEDNFGASGEFLSSPWFSRVCFYL